MSEPVEAATDACPRYRRSLDGKVIHTLDCTRTRRAGVEWTYAEGMPLEWLIEQLPKYPWLRLCKFCFTQPEAGPMSANEQGTAALVALALEPARYVYRARRQDDTTWWEVIQGYREGGDIEPGTEHPVIRFLPQPTADAFAHALTDAFDRGRKQGYEYGPAKTSGTAGDEHV